MGKVNLYHRWPHPARDLEVVLGRFRHQPLRQSARIVEVSVCTHTLKYRQYKTISPSFSGTPRTSKVEIISEIHRDIVRGTVSPEWLTKSQSESTFTGPSNSSSAQPIAKRLCSEAIHSWTDLFGVLSPSVATGSHTCIDVFKVGG